MEAQVKKTGMSKRKYFFAASFLPLSQKVVLTTKHNHVKLTFLDLIFLNVLLLQSTLYMIYQDNLTCGEHPHYLHIFVCFSFSTCKLPLHKCYNKINMQNSEYTLSATVRSDTTIYENII